MTGVLVILLVFAVLLFGCQTSALSMNTQRTRGPRAL